MSDDGAPASPAAAVASALVHADAVTEPIATPFVFTGEGGEYFRIWVVNTVLSIATIGIYSAWAKVRKASYFARNTTLLGDSFDFTADPLAILRGRVLAVVLFGIYSLSFDFSLELGLAATAGVLAAAPLLFASATRFRLRNMRWRAFRFDFTATRAQSYRTITIVIAFWLSGTVAGAFGNNNGVLVAGGLTVLLLPWMHHRMKAFQHGHAAVAGWSSTFRSGLGRFYVTYLVAASMFVLPAAVGIFISFGLPLMGMGTGLGATIGLIVGLGVPALSFLAMWPYFAARIQRIVWERTTLGPCTFRTSITFKGLLPIALKNIALLLLTAGLYWPFAAVAWARYRIGCMSIVSGESPAASLAQLRASVAAGSAFGEGAVDFFGIDVGW